MIDVYCVCVCAWGPCNFAKGKDLAACGTQGDLSLPLLAKEYSLDIFPRTSTGLCAFIHICVIFPCLITIYLMFPCHCVIAFSDGCAGFSVYFDLWPYVV